MAKENESNENYLEKILSLYEEKSKSFKRTFGILLAASIFFIFIIFVPYISTLDKKNETSQKIEDIPNITNALTNIQNSINKLNSTLHIEKIVSLYF